MRSLIKSHRRSDSSTSDMSQLEVLYSKAPAKTTPLNSPLMNLYQHMTPPHAMPSGTSSAMSSPKKLLTPIKKMFGHHLKPTVPHDVAVTTDLLASAVARDFEPPRGRRTFRRGPNSFTNLLELQKASALPERPKVHTLTLMVFVNYQARPESFLVHPPKILPTLQSSLESSVGLQKTATKPDAMPIIFDPKLLSLRSRANDSDGSIAKSEGNFNAKLDTDLPLQASRTDAEAFYEADDDLKDSDASSQFSFVKDIRGGRNTSVKYYKTKTSAKAKQRLQNFFNVEDMGFENDALSDYDFENNGMDDDIDDLDDNDFETNNRFGDFLEDNADNGSPAGSPPASHTGSLADENYGDLDPDYDDFETPDLNGSPKDFREESFRALSSPYGTEFLDSYLDKTRLPQPDAQGTHLFIPSAFEAEGSPSPLINGVTFGSETKFRSTRSVKSVNSNKSAKVPQEDHADIGLGIQQPQDTASEKRNSIANMMDLLSALETDREADTVQRRGSIIQMKSLLNKLDEEDAPKDTNQRNLVVDMMSTLASLESNLKMDSPESKKSARKSIIDMMNTLATLDSLNAEAVKPSEPKKELKKPNAPPKSQVSQRSLNRTTSSGRRYSWSNTEDDFNAIRDDPKSGFEYPSTSTQLEDDLLDEVNLLPEDFDSNDIDNQMAEREVPNFYRSNSYNKRPLKVVNDYNYQKNTIETSLKTLTFYRTNSLGNASQPKSRSLSRATSVRSATSLTSINDDDQSQLDLLRVKQTPYGHHLNTHMHGLSSDSISKTSINLEPITESESPLL